MLKFDNLILWVYYVYPQVSWLKMSESVILIVKIMFFFLKENGENKRALIDS